MYYSGCRNLTTNEASPRDKKQYMQRYRNVRYHAWFREA